MKALSKLIGSTLALSLTFGSLASANSGEGDQVRQGNGPRVPLAYIAEAFSVDVDTLIAEFHAGATLKEVAIKYGVSEESLGKILQDLKVKQEENKPVKPQDHSKKPKHHSLMDLSDDARAYLASLLGVTVEDLAQAKEDGVSFKAYVEAHGLTVKEVFASLKAYKANQ